MFDTTDNFIYQNHEYVQEKKMENEVPNQQQQKNLMDLQYSNE